MDTGRGPGDVCCVQVEYRDKLCGCGDDKDEHRQDFSFSSFSEVCVLHEDLCNTETD